jgi:hypothetical protein
MTVPFLDLARMNSAVTEGVLHNVAELLETGAFTIGPQVPRFEEAFGAIAARAVAGWLASSKLRRTTIVGSRTIVVYDKHQRRALRVSPPMWYLRSRRRSRSTALPTYTTRSAGRPASTPSRPG